jgi:hypothetical protein
MESGTRSRLAPPAGAHFTQRAPSTYWQHLWNQVHAPDWLHQLALTLLNAHPALTGTIYGIRYVAQIGSICWRSLYSTRIQRSLSPSMESGTRPKFTPPAVVHFTQCASSAHWHLLWNKIFIPDWLHLLVLIYSMSVQHSLAPTMESGVSTRLAPPAASHFTKRAASAHWHHLWNQVCTPDWLHLLALTFLNTHPALSGTIFGIRYMPQTGYTCGHSLKSTGIQHSLASSMESGERPRYSPSDWLNLMALTLFNRHPVLTGTTYGIRYRPQTGSTCWR